MSIHCLATATPVRSLGPFGHLPSTLDNQNQFQIGELLLKTGSMNAKVYLAKESSNGRSVVIKQYQLDHSCCKKGEDLAHFVRHEVSTLKMLRHPHILTCLASFVVNQEIWLVTPLMEVGSVSRLISSYFAEGLPELVCCFILRDVLSALQYLHLQGVVHRSVRCSHILINELGDCVLGGFRYCTKLHSTGEHRSNLYDYPMHGITSNLCWLAPEILKQNLLGYNETSDIYSLGVTACEMANGMIPYSDFPSTLMLLEKLRGSSPRLIDFSTLSALQQEEEGVEPVERPTPADSGVGDSVGSSSNVISKNSAFYNREFSPGFHDFVSECTISFGEERKSAFQLLSHPFIKQLKKTTANLLTLLHPLQPIHVAPDSQQQDEEGFLIKPMKRINLDDPVTGGWDFD